MKSIVAILSVFCIGTISAASVDSGRIVNGTQAAEGEFPFFASVYDNGAHVCGGFIYNTRFVITTAGCVAGRNVGGLTIVAGQINLITVEPNEVVDVVREVFLNPNYDSATGANDIALLQLRNPLEFNDFVYYAPYDEVNPNNPDGIFMGFGSVINAEQAFSRLLKTTLQFNQDCSSYANFMVNNMICAGTAGSSPCSFDEGGPIIQTGPNGPVAKGILSRQNCTAGTPAVFTRLSTYYDFINNIAGGPYVPTVIPPDTTVAQDTTVAPTDAATTLPPDTVAPTVVRRHLRH